MTTSTNLSKSKKTPRKIITVILLLAIVIIYFQANAQSNGFSVIELKKSQIATSTPHLSVEDILNRTLKLLSNSENIYEITNAKLRQIYNVQGNEIYHNDDEELGFLGKINAFYYYDIQKYKLHDSYNIIIDFEQFVKKPNTLYQKMDEKVCKLNTKRFVKKLKQIGFNYKEEHKNLNEWTYYNDNFFIKVFSKHHGFKGNTEYCVATITISKNI